MQQLLRSEYPLFCVRFRDYVRAEYHTELVLSKQWERGVCITVLSVSDDTPRLDEIMRECRRYLEEPFHPRYKQAGWQSGEANRQVVPYSLRDILRSYGFSLHRLLRHGKFTLFLTALCCAIYLLQWLGWEEQIMLFAHYPDEIGEDSQVWRYLTHSLVHLSPWHILFNLVWWWIFGGLIERQFGSGKLILLFLISAVISGIAQNFASGPAFFGLSGVVYAVLGFVFCADRYGGGTFELPQGFFYMLLAGIAVGFVSPLIGVQIGNAAHISGLLTGLAGGLWQAKSAEK